jgi:hypothetical protein
MGTIHELTRTKHKQKADALSKASSEPATFKIINTQSSMKVFKLSLQQVGKGGLPPLRLQNTQAADHSAP